MMVLVLKRVATTFAYYYRGAVKMFEVIKEQIFGLGNIFFST